MCTQLYFVKMPGVSIILNYSGFFRTQNPKLPTKFPIFYDISRVPPLKILQGKYMHEAYAHGESRTPPPPKFFNSEK